MAAGVSGGSPVSKTCSLVNFRGMLKEEIRSILEWQYGTAPAATDPLQHFGPYSFWDYVTYKAARGVYGDVLDLYMFGVTFNVRVTVIDGDTLREFRVAHNTPLSSGVDVELPAGDPNDPEATRSFRMPTVRCVLVHTGNHHFVSCGEC